MSLSEELFVNSTDASRLDANCVGRVATMQQYHYDAIREPVAAREALNRKRSCFVCATSLGTFWKDGLDLVQLCARPILF